MYIYKYKNSSNESLRPRNIQILFPPRCIFWGGRTDLLPPPPFPSRRHRETSAREGEGSHWFILPPPPASRLKGELRPLKGMTLWPEVWGGGSPPKKARRGGGGARDKCRDFYELFLRAGMLKMFINFFLNKYLRFCGGKYVNIYAGK